MIVFRIAVIFIICFALGFITYYRGLLNADGSIAAFFIGLFIALQGGLTLIILLLVFLASAFLATRYKFSYKKERGLEEGFKGERGWTNVLANGIVPVSVLLLYNSGYLVSFGFLNTKFAIPLFVLAIAAAASDTLASEIGMASKKVYLITNFKRVKPGTNGGISAYGELWAMIGSVYTFLIAQFIFYFVDMTTFSPRILLFGSFIGFLSCQVDSVLGATLERRGLLNKSLVNLLAISISVTIFGGLIYVW
ncbi:MAG: DUF92 domain-containing protein [Candidatus Thermoplasmatota archaeon]|nr:DUF92 domain-containing protein [Candidatus Thermoplasmatota archaeon]